MLAIFKREVRSYFNSPIAYVLMGLFILVTSIFFFLGNIRNMSADFSPTLGTVNFLLIFIIPMLTMRVLAEDRKNGTEVLLISSPVSLSKMVLGKYLSMLFVFGVMTLLTVVYPLTIFIFGKPPIAPLLSSYIGFFFFGAALIAIGVFASSLTENQVIAVLISFVFMLIIWLIQPLATAVGGVGAKILGWFSLTTRFDTFSSGILDIGSIIYFLSFIAVFIFLTIRVIEKTRWSQG